MNLYCLCLRICCLFFAFCQLALFDTGITAQVHLKNHSIVDNNIVLTLQFDSDPYLLEGEGHNVINYYNETDESKPGSPVLPSKAIFVAIPPQSKVKVNPLNEKFNYLNNVFIKSNPTIEIKSDSTLLYLDSEINPEYTRTEVYPQNKYIVKGYTWIREFYCVVITLNTHTYSWRKRQLSELSELELKLHIYDMKNYIINDSPLSEFDKSLSKIILNYETAENYRSFPPNVFNDSTGNWIDYSKEYVKLAIPDDGIYRINYADISNYGVPITVNPKTIKIFANGKEIPLWAPGEENNSLDPGDYFEFWAAKNYSNSNYRNLVTKGENYLTYLDIYSDTSIIWLTWDGNNGLRIKEIDEYISDLTDTVTSHLAKIHLEKDNLLWFYGAVVPRIQLPFWHENKTWIWQQVTHGGTSSFPFSVNSVVPNTPVYTVTRLNSWYSDGLIQNAHKYGAKLNSTDIQDSVIFNFETIANLKANFNSNDLVEGVNNYRIAGMPNEQEKDHNALVDWIDIDYFQFTEAVYDSLLIRIPDSVSIRTRVIKVINYVSDSSSALVYKIKPERKKFSSYLIKENILTFTDTVNGGDEYLVINDDQIKHPNFVEKKRFVNLRNKEKQADYILITHNSLQESANDYANFIESSYNKAGILKVETVFVNDIYDEFGYGYLKPEPIKDFLEYAYKNWQSPKPSYLTLLGDCTYDYKNLFTSVPTPRKKILVPSYGNSVSDIWFTTWDTSNVNVQQMLVGRIPANNDEEVYRYLRKHQIYHQRHFDDWNKSFLLFSGGFHENPSELQQIKQANDKVLTNIIKPAPVGGDALHFYKTISPQTNFGPYTTTQIQEGFDNGGLFISYVGHSGTRTWDNGITEPSDISNAYNNRFPVISDNGCSTGKFAEPDVDAFGELFTNQDVKGQAIAYLGNSSLGYSSTAYRMPEIFYKRLIVDSTSSIGEAHFLAKMDNFNQSGFGDVNRLYNYCNILLGDPIIRLAFPDKPNFVVNENSIKFEKGFITDNTDSTEIKLILANWGVSVNDSLNIDVSSNYNDTTTYSHKFLIKSPLFKDTLTLRIPILGLAGDHGIKIELDKANLIEEVYEDDNIVEVNFKVFSSKLRPIESELFYNSSRNIIKVLNPVTKLDNQISEIEFALSQNPDFSNQVLLNKGIDSISTSVQLNNLQPDTRYYWRARLKGIEQEWSQSISFFNRSDYPWFLNHSFNPEDIRNDGVEFDYTNKAWKLKSSENILKITSAGSNEGKFASMQFNHREMLPNTFFWGIATAEMDTFTFEPHSIRYFVYPRPESADSLINYINSLSPGTVVAMAVCDDAAQSVLGFSSGTPVRKAIETLGSFYIDSVRYRESWSIIGRKGAPQGTVPEVYKKLFEGQSIIDTSKFIRYTKGTIQFPIVENSIQWLNVIKHDSTPSGSLINYYPIGYKANNEVDTLNHLQFFENEASIDFIDVDKYKKISIIADLAANNNFKSPIIKEIAINFVPPPELGTNYQVVSVLNDSVITGANVDLKFYVYNVGESRADSFNVKVEVVNPDNSKEIIFESLVDTLNSLSRKLFDISYNASTGIGNKAFNISIDSGDKILELYEDNNFYSIPFYVFPDTSAPSLNITFDGVDILDGDFVSANPEINIELLDPSSLPLNDTSSVSLFLNEKEIYFANNPEITYQFSPSNPKMVVSYKPHLRTGEYNLKVFGKNESGNVADSSGIEKNFIVNEETEILNVYNYPNPSKGESYFTFKLTQIPDELKIKIYTVAGRLIKEIKKTSAELKYDFNTIYWDGKDDDHNRIANGVYLYKIIINKDGKNKNVTEKLAIVK